MAKILKNIANNHAKNNAAVMAARIKRAAEMQKAMQNTDTSEMTPEELDEWFAAWWNYVMVGGTHP